MSEVIRCTLHGDWFGTPVPGSDAALEHGCLCPEDQPGEGKKGDSVRINLGCPLHGQLERVPQ